MKGILFVLLVMCFELSFGQIKIGRNDNGNYSYNLDDQLSMCLDDSNTVVGHTNCYLKFSGLWHDEISKYEKLIKIHLTGELKNNFTESQNKWLEWSDIEKEISYSIYRDINTQRIDIYYYHVFLVELYRNRAIELEKLLENKNFK